MKKEKSRFCIFALFFFMSISFCLAQTKPDADNKIMAVRGVWLTNVASDVLYSKENIKQAINFLADAGFNTVFVVTWNKQHTTYPSQVTKKYFGYSIQQEFEGRDPLQEVIDVAKEKNMKVFAWFEFGFASSIGDDTGGIIIQKYPHWASRQKNGEITAKNNFQWLNPFHPEVQSFMDELILETVSKYDIDGIQGDDRLPALPSNGGYSTYTVDLYKAEHNGASPPNYEKDYDWIKWRSRKLSNYLKNMTAKVKKQKPEIIISMSPSIYPWAEENYLQDWPAWINMGLVDILVPQVYRYDFKTYKKELEKIISSQLSKKNQNFLYPGILLQVNDYTAPSELLESCIKLNRKHGIYGEVFFFYEGVPKRKSLFLNVYKDSALFPSQGNQPR